MTREEAYYVLYKAGHNTMNGTWLYCILRELKNRGFNMLYTKPVEEVLIAAARVYKYKSKEYKDILKVIKIYNERRKANW